MGNLSAQTSKVKSLSFQFINEQIVNSPNLLKGDGPAYPGGTLAYELSSKTQGLYQFAHVLQIGYFHHRKVNQVAFIGWKPQFELVFGKMIRIHAIPGLSYGHSLPTQTIYRIENGEYVKSKTFGRSHFMPSVGLGIGLDLGAFDIPIEIFLRQEMAVLFPNTRRLPISINSVYGIGISFQISPNSEIHE